MEDDPHKRRRDRIANLGASLSDMLAANRDGAQQYEAAGSLGRWLIRHREPQVFSQYQKFEKVRAVGRASASIETARLSAYANEGQEVIIF